MAESTEWSFQGSEGRVMVREWPNDEARYVAVLAHGYGEHIGRYEHVAQTLVEHGAAVYGPDHIGHGRSEGERALVEDFAGILSDLESVVERARAAHPDLPVVLLGHSMGGLIAARYAQLFGDGLTALVLSGPVIGGNPEIEALLEIDPMPEVPVQLDWLSRDPEVGRAYAEDPLVYDGPFKRRTLEVLFGAIADLGAGPSFGSLPTLWIHGEEDPLAPLGPAREAIERLKGEDFEQHVYPGARHEVLNETNKDEVIGHVTGFVDRRLR